MERIKERLVNLRTEADKAIDRAEAAETKNKLLEQQLLECEQVVKSLSHRLELEEKKTEKLEAEMHEHKTSSAASESSKSTAENLARKVQLLEEELDTAEKNVKETVEKLRQVDVKAEHYERQVLRVEKDRDEWEKKYEEMKEKHHKTQTELEELERTMDQL